LRKRGGLEKFEARTEARPIMPLRRDHRGC
jgi:hypothetical protein